MEINIMRKENSNRYAVMFNGVFSFDISEETYYKHNLRDEDCISKECIKKIKKYESVLTAKNTAIKFLGYRIRTENEIRVKLIDIGYESNTIEEAIDELKRIGWVNDKLFAEKYIRESQKLKPKSIQKLKYELKNKGIDGEIIFEAIEKANINELEDAIALIKKRFRIGYSDFLVIDENKIINFLKYRGYSSNIILKVINDFKLYPYHK